jgi:hypothetical protein
VLYAIFSYSVLILQLSTYLRRQCEKLRCGDVLTGVVVIIVSVQKSSPSKQDGYSTIQIKFSLERIRDTCTRNIFNYVFHIPERSKVPPYKFRYFLLLRIQLLERLWAKIRYPEFLFCGVMYVPSLV